MNNLQNQHEQNELNWQNAVASGATNKELEALEKALSLSGIALKRETIRQQLADKATEEKKHETAKQGILDCEQELLDYYTKLAELVTMVNSELKEVAERLMVEAQKLPNPVATFAKLEQHHRTLELPTTLSSEVRSKCINTKGIANVGCFLLVQGLSNYIQSRGDYVNAQATMYPRR